MTRQDALSLPKTFWKKLQKTLDFFLIVWDNYNVRKRGNKSGRIKKFYWKIKYWARGLWRLWYCIWYKRRIIKNYWKTIDK